MQQAVKTILSDGMVRYRLSNGDLHRIDGPAIEFPCGAKEYWVNGKIHRIGGPALVSGKRIKYRLGPSGCGRDDDPSTSLAPVAAMYIVYDKKHRTEGPAVIYEDGVVQYWLDDKKISEYEWLIRTMWFDKEMRTS